MSQSSQNRSLGNNVKFNESYETDVALWVRIQTFLKNTKMGDIAKIQNGRHSKGVANTL
jgi:hypothetical protein